MSPPTSAPLVKMPPPRRAKIEISEARRLEVRVVLRDDGEQWRETRITANRGDRQQGLGNLLRIIRQANELGQCRIIGLAGGGEHQRIEGRCTTGAVRQGLAHGGEVLGDPKLQGFVRIAPEREKRLGVAVAGAGEDFDGRPPVL
jgi:hypothetical protein